MDPFVAEIRIFPFSFAPKGWAACDGQLLLIAQNAALFSVVGTIYGGNGTSSFALPDLRGRTPMSPGQGLGLSSHDLGEAGGAETVTLLESEVPAHPHVLRAAPGSEDDNQPAGNVLARPTGSVLYAAPSNLVSMAPEALSPTGGNVPHNNLQPFLTFYFCISLQGVQP